jgi:2-oxoglutarate ferredoxin oxidoreductase subunit beta
MSTLPPAPLRIEDFKSAVAPDWCPGCGDFGVLRAVQSAAAGLGIAPHELMIVSGIGCSSNLPGFVHSYGLHSIHGRSLPVATGIKLANTDLTVLVAGGDGDGYGIGAGHFVHAARRNVDLTYLVMDNSIYGLTTGQTSPTSALGMKTKSTPAGNAEQPLNPLLLALSSGASFVARGFSGDPNHLAELVKRAIRHRGFAVIDVFSPCVTYNKVNTTAFYKQRVYKLEEQGHDATSLVAATERALELGERIPIGVLYAVERPTYEELDPVLRAGNPMNRPRVISQELGQELLAELG